MAASSSSSPLQIHPALGEIAPFIFTSDIQLPEELGTALMDISDVLSFLNDNPPNKNQIDQLKPALEIIKRYVSECKRILHKPEEISLKSTIYLNILSILDCHFQATQQTLKEDKKAFRKVLKSKEQGLAEKEEKKESIKEEKKELDAWKKSSMEQLTIKEQRLIAAKKAFIEAFLEDLIKLQQYTVELKRNKLWELCIVALTGIPVPSNIQDATIFVPPPETPWLVSDPCKPSFELRVGDAFSIIATVKSRLESAKLYDNYVPELNTAIRVIEKYRRDREEREDDIAKWHVLACKDAENYANNLRSALFRLREMTKEAPKTIPRAKCSDPSSDASDNDSERGGASFFGSKQKVEINENSSLGNAEIATSINTPHLEKPVVNADLTFQLLRENERKKESRIGKFIRKHPVKAAAIIIFGCLTILCVGTGIGLLTSGIGIGIAAGIGAAGISLLSVGPVYPVIVGGAYCLYKAYYNQLKKQFPDDDGAYFRHTQP